MTLKYLEGVAMTRPMLMPYKIPSTTLTNTLYMGSTRFVREKPLSALLITCATQASLDTMIGLLAKGRSLASHDDGHLHQGLCGEQ